MKGALRNFVTIFWARKLPKQPRSWYVSNLGMNVNKYDHDCKKSRFLLNYSTDFAFRTLQETNKKQNNRKYCIKNLLDQKYFRTKFFTKRLQFLVFDFKSWTVAFDSSAIYWSWKQALNKCKQCLTYASMTVKQRQDFLLNHCIDFAFHAIALTKNTRKT